MSSFGTKGYMTLEPSNSSQEEQISFSGITANANGTTTLTGVKTVLFITPFTETSGTAKAHPGGSKAIVSNTSAFYNALASELNTEIVTGIWTFPSSDATRARIASDTDTAVDTAFVTFGQLSRQAISGASNMGLAVKGIGEEATAAEINAGTQTGSTSAELVVNPKYLHDSVYSAYLPGILEKEALVGYPGSPSTSNKYLTQSFLPSGSITMYGGAAAPTGWLLCDGSAVSRTTYSALFSAIGSLYGNGNATTTFNVPDLRGRVPVGAGTGAGGGLKGAGTVPSGGSVLSEWTPGLWFGEEKHTQTEAELAAHTHPAQITTGSTSTGLPTITAVANSATFNTGSTGSSTPFNVIQPMMVVSFIIKT
jgi:microcystin-dependent protein